MAEAEPVESYAFTPDDLKPERRLPGISAFMRIKNGAPFLEATIHSHIEHFDEIVAVYNQCTDATPDILARLAQAYGPKLRVYHYLPKVHPPGSEGHVKEPPGSPASFVTMSNFALAATRHRVAVKLDDDHMAMKERLAALVARVRTDGDRLDHVACFSGLNLARDESGRLGVLAVEPFSGNGDIGFFAVTPRTHFIHRPRFEDFDHDNRRRIFADIVYWHMKHLKPGYGFANRDIEAGNPRFERKRARFLANRRVIAVTELAASAPAGLSLLAGLPLPEKARLKIDRWRRLRQDGPTDADLAAVDAERNGRSAS